MKIKVETPYLLILEDRPWFLGGLLVLLILIFAGFGINALAAGRATGLLGLVGAGLWGVALVVFVRKTTVTFDRPAAEVRRNVSSFRKTSATIWALGDIQLATVETRLSRNSRKSGRSTATPLHRPALQWTDCRPALPLVEVYASGDRASTAADAINRWLGVPTSLDSADAAP